jgi:hypothetical protein
MWCCNLFLHQIFYYLFEQLLMVNGISSFTAMQYIYICIYNTYMYIQYIYVYVYTCYVAPYSFSLTICNYLFNCLIILLANLDSIFKNGLSL